jgi:hypothetical protein
VKLESNLFVSTSQYFVSSKNDFYSYVIECDKCYSDIHLYKSSDITNIFHKRHERFSLINNILSARVFNNYFCDISEFWIIEFKIFAFNLIECVGEEFIVIFSVKIIYFLIFNVIFKLFVVIIDMICSFYYQKLFSMYKFDYMYYRPAVFLTRIGASFSWKAFAIISYT